MDFDYLDNLILENSETEIPFYRAASGFTMLKKMAEEGMPDSVPMEGPAVPVAPEEAVCGTMAQLVALKFCKQLSYIMYGTLMQSIAQDANRSDWEGHAETEKCHAQFYLRRLNAMKGEGFLVPSMPPPPPLKNPDAIIQQLMGYEEQALALMGQLRTMLQDGDPTRFQVEQQMTEDQYHLDQLKTRLSAAPTPTAAKMAALVGEAKTARYRQSTTTHWGGSDGPTYSTTRHEPTAQEFAAGQKKWTSMDQSARMKQVGHYPGTAAIAGGAAGGFGGGALGGIAGAALGGSKGKLIGRVVGGLGGALGGGLLGRKIGRGVQKYTAARREAPSGEVYGLSREQAIDEAEAAHAAKTSKKTASLVVARLIKMAQPEPSPTPGAPLVVPPPNQDTPEAYVARERQLQLDQAISELAATKMQLNQTAMSAQQAQQETMQAQQELEEVGAQAEQAQAQADEVGQMSQAHQQQAVEAEGRAANHATQKMQLGMRVQQMRTALAEIAMQDPVTETASGASDLAAQGAPSTPAQIEQEEMAAQQAEQGGEVPPEAAKEQEQAARASEEAEVQGAQAENAMAGGPATAGGPAAAPAGPAEMSAGMGAA